MRWRQPPVHDEAYLAWIRQLPCVICLDNTSTEAAHVRKADLRAGKRYVGKGEKADDRWAVPLCSECHRHQHEMRETEFWEAAEIDPVKLALALHSVSGDAEMGETIIRAHH